MVRLKAKWKNVRLLQLAMQNLLAYKFHEIFGKPHMLPPLCKLQTKGLNICMGVQLAEG